MAADDLKALLPKGPICTWPDWEDEDDCERNGDWIVGVPLTGLNGAPCEISKFEHGPPSWVEIAKVRGRTFAEALAAHLRTLREE